MIKSCVTINLVPDIKIGPWIYWNNLETSCEKASDLGFDAIELFVSSAESLDKKNLKSVLRNYNLQLAAVGTGAGKVLKGLTLSDSDSRRREKAVDYIKGIIDFGADFDAPAIIGSMQGSAGSASEIGKARFYLKEGLKELSAHAKMQGVQLLFEPLNRYETNIYNTVNDAVEMVMNVDEENLAILADLFHMNIEESSISNTLKTHMKNIGHIHFADSNRGPVGMGHTEMNSVAGILKEASYTGFISAEAFPWPDPDTAAKQTINSFKKYFRV